MSYAPTESVVKNIWEVRLRVESFEPEDDDLLYVSVYFYGKPSPQEAIDEALRLKHAYKGDTVVCTEITKLKIKKSAKTVNREKGKRSYH